MKTEREGMKGRLADSAMALNCIMSCSAKPSGTYVRTYVHTVALWAQTCVAACQHSSSHPAPCPLCQLMQRIGPVGSR